MDAMDAMEVMEVQVNGETMEPVQTGSFGTETLPLQVNGEPSLLEVATAELHMQNGDGSDIYISEYEAQQDLPTASTGYVYDTRMLDHWPTIEPDENDFPHPEQPARISMIYSALRTAMCFKKMRKLSTRSLEKYEAMLIHSEDHWDKVEAIALMDEEAIRDSEEYYERLSLYVHKHTPQVAKLSAGGVIETCLAVARGDVRNAFAIVRPPGHHAEPEEHMGFCFFNNVAIAARVVQEMTPLKRVLILDWDVHHGNGTQRAFWTDDSVLYISLHRYEQGTFYPSGPFGSMESCGEGKGLGKSVNVPWPVKGMGDADYLYAFEKIVLPIAYEFAPELVIISAGFDAADGDVLGECHVSPGGFAHMTHMLSCLAGGKLAVALEGGYNLNSNASSSLAVAQVLLGEAPPELPSMVASEEATETVWQVAMQQSKYWKCMHPKAVEPREESPVHTTSIPEILKVYRANFLFNTHQMYQVPFVDERLGLRFSGQMVCTKNVYAGTGTLVVFMHDLCNLRVELDGKLNCDVQQEKSYLEDATKQLIDWVTSSEEFSFIDLNLNPHPLVQTRLQHSNNTVEQDIRDVVTYIWDNYIELSEARHVIIVCHSAGSYAVMNLLKSREVKRKVRGIIHIAATGLPPRTPQNEMQQWYRQRSLSFVSAKRRTMDDDTKYRKRYGNIRWMDADSSVRLLSGAMPQIQTFVAELIGNALPSLPAQTAEPTLGNVESLV